MGNDPSVLMAGYTAMMTSVSGFMFGILWARTRGLGLVVAAHAATDLMPILTEFIKARS